jgi:hypothetical protein
MLQINCVHQGQEKLAYSLYYNTLVFLILRKALFKRPFVVIILLAFFDNKKLCNLLRYTSVKYLELFLKTLTKS